MAEVPIFLLLKFESFFIDALPKIVGIGTNVSGFNERESEDDFLSTMLSIFSPVEVEEPHLDDN